MICNFPYLHLWLPPPHARLRLLIRPLQVLPRLLDRRHDAPDLEVDERYARIVVRLEAAYKILVDAPIAELVAILVAIDVREERFRVLWHVRQRHQGRAG